jgi:hypothetical protein
MGGGAIPGGAQAGGTEQAALDDVDAAFHEREFRRLLAMLERERDASRLSEMSSVRPALDDLLIRVRLRGP